MTPAFLNLPIAAETTDGRNWTLTKPLEYRMATGRVVRAAVGTTTDGPSVPDAFRVALSPFGLPWPCGVLHDAGYRDTLEMQAESGEWKHIRLCRDACDDLFKEALFAQGVPADHAEIFYQAVHVFGLKAFGEDRTATFHLANR